MDQPIQLPSGDRMLANRGAGQGETDGPLKAAVCIGWCVKKAKAELTAEGITQWADVWYLDDGQLVCKPADLERILVVLDKHLAAAGASRGFKSKGDCIKSTVRVYCFGDKARFADAVSGMGPHTGDPCDFADGSEG